MREERRHPPGSEAGREERSVAGAGKDSLLKWSRTRRVGGDGNTHGAIDETEGSSGESHRRVSGRGGIPGDAPFRSAPFGAILGADLNLLASFERYWSHRRDDDDETRNTKT